jgi:hypothetical protein
MRFKLLVVTGLLWALSATALVLALGMPKARASECGEQIRLLDDRYSLGTAAPTEAPRAPAAEQTSSSGSSGAPSASAGLDTVPNTGGIANPRNTPVERLDDAQRERVREALAAARRADDASDGTTCAAKVAEARRIAQGGTAEPTAK